jgi:hypothetical protein
MRKTVGQVLVQLFVLGGLGWISYVSAGDTLETDARMRGRATAPVTLIEYSDFTCGYCLKFFKDTWPRIQARYVDTGKVRFFTRIIREAIRAQELMLPQRHDVRVTKESIGGCMTGCSPQEAGWTSRSISGMRSRSPWTSPRLNGV